MRNRLIDAALGAAAVLLAVLAAAGPGLLL